MNKKRILVICAIVIVFAITAWLYSQNAGHNNGVAIAKEQATGENQTDISNTGWQKRCSDQNENQCEVFQAVSMNANSQNVRLVDFALSKVDNTARLGITLPLGVTLTNGLKFQVDDGKIMQMPFNTCGANGCSAVSVIEDDVLSNFKSGKELNIYFSDRVQKPINVKLNLAGLTKSLSSL